MKKLSKFLTILLVIAVVLSCFTSCSSTPKSIDFENYSNVNLFKLIDKKVSIIGYFLLTSPAGNTAYISNIPYKAYSVPQGEDESTGYLLQLSFSEYKTIAVTFKELPEYTSVPVKITGTLEGGPFTDTNMFSYDYRIKDAVVEPVDPQYLSTENQIYYALAEKGYLDLIYTNTLDLELFLYSEDGTTFPEFKEYAEVAKNFEGKTLNEIETNYLDLLNSLNAVYEKYKTHTEAGSIDPDEYLEDIDNVYYKLDVFINQYATIEFKN